jgi:hypothetical protein
MQIELIEDPLILTSRNAQTITLALHDHQGSSYVVRGSLVNDETKSTDEQMRLLLSWHVVLGEIGSSEQGAGQW